MRQQSKNVKKKYKDKEKLYGLSVSWETPVSGQQADPFKASKSAGPSQLGLQESPRALWPPYRSSEV